MTDINLHSLRPGTELRVDTRNSCYRIQMLDGNECTALVHGGEYFSHEAEARIGGSAVGGEVVKEGWICLGFGLQLSIPGKQIVTSRVRAIDIDPLPDSHNL